MKSKCAIMQPHFLPWSGYFNLISKVDKFVFLMMLNIQKIAGKIGIIFYQIVKVFDKYSL